MSNITLETIQETFSDSSLSIYDKKRSLIRFIKEIITENFNNNIPAVTTNKDSRMIFLRDCLLKIIKDEINREDERRPLYSVIELADEKYIDKSILNDFTFEEWTLLDSMIDESVETKFTCYGILELMRRKIGNTKTSFRPCQYILVKCMLEFRNGTDRLSAIKNLYKSYCNGSKKFN